MDADNRGGEKDSATPKGTVAAGKQPTGIKPTTNVNCTGECESGPDGTLLGQQNVAERRRKGERNHTKDRHGTPNPDKHMKPVPGKPGSGYVRDPHTGRDIGPKPWPNDPRLNNPAAPGKSESVNWWLMGVGVTAVGLGIIFVPEVTVPALVIGGGGAAASW